MDPFGRKIDYLRISVTDRCNERCLYCMPEGYKGWESKPDHLTAEEIVRVVRVAAGLGFRKFRLTGGEPLVRADVPEIVRAMTAIPGVASVGLSTNGMKLTVLVQPLHDAGLRTVNVSLDALDPAIYHRITGGDVTRVLAGIRAAVMAGFERVKLNCVLMRGVNEAEIWPLVLFAAEHGLPLRLIELMPLTTTEVLTEKNFLPCGEAMQLLAQKDELVPQPDRKLGPRAGKVLFVETNRRARRVHRRADERAFLRQLQQDAAHGRRQGASLPGQSHRSGFARGVAARRGRRRFEGIAGNRAAAETAGAPVPQSIPALSADDRHRRVKNQN